MLFLVILREWSWNGPLVRFLIISFVHIVFFIIVMFYFSEVSVCIDKTNFIFKCSLLRVSIQSHIIIHLHIFYSYSCLYGFIFDLCRWKPMYSISWQDERDQSFMSRASNSQKSTDYFVWWKRHTCSSNQRRCWNQSSFPVCTVICNANNLKCLMFFISPLSI